MLVDKFIGNWIQVHISATQQGDGLLKRAFK